MRFSRIIFLMGILIALYGVIAFLPPLLISWWLHDGQTVTFRNALVLSSVLGSGFYLAGTHDRNWDLRMRDGIIIVVLFWLTIGCLGTLPFLLQQQLALSLSSAMFESFSGLTTTGATIIVDLDSLPPSILFYRQLLQWFGGMGIIILAVAILPILGVGGLQLYRAEIPGPSKDMKLTPRIAGTAKSLWYIYLALTVSCAIAYVACGMPLLDAVNYSFSTVSIGGFAPHNQGLSFYPGNGVKIVASLFMLISGVNFALHFLALSGLRPQIYWRDPECKTYLSIHAVLAVACCLYMAFFYESSLLDTEYVDIVFQSISIATTAGFTLPDYRQWPEFMLLLLLFSSFIGASAGSVGGGLKVIRVYLLFKQGSREIFRMIHPRASSSIRAGETHLSDRIVDAIWGFFSVYVLLFTILLMAMIATGLDQVTSFSAVAACMNNLGPGLGEVSAHYADINTPAKWILIIAMLLGRLEIFTIMALFTATFWRK